VANSNSDSQLDKNGLVKPILSHEIIQAYLEDDLSELQRQQIADTKKEYSEYELLFYLLDELKSKISLSEIPEPKSEEWLTHTELEKGLYKIFAGEISRAEAEKLISGLHQSQTIYRKMLTKVGDILPQMQDVPELSEIAIKSNEEILSEIVGPEHVVAEETSKESWLKHILSYRISLPAYAYLAPALALLLVFVTFEFVLEHRTAYVYDDNVPVPFSTSVSTFRDISGAETDNQFDTFLRQFQVAIRDYELLDYESAIERMERIRPLAESILNESTNENAPELIKDYYFYLGVTHFALFRSQKLPSDERTEYGDKAVAALETCDEIAEEYSLTVTDREHYFLALANLFTGQARAEAELKQIGPESPYFERSRELLSEF